MRRLLGRWRPDIHRDGMLLVGLLFGLAQVQGLVPLPTDAVAYWQAGTSTRLYPEHWGSPGTGQWLYYPPPIAQISSLLHPIGWNLFIVALTTVTFGAMWYCARRWSFPLLIAGVLALVGLVPDELATFLAYAALGNLQWILAATTLVALRQPTLWSVELATKVTSSIGWWWYAVRGEWRPAAIGASAAIAVIGISFLASPGLWADFISFTMRNGDMSNPPIVAFELPFGLRLATAAILVAWGARTDRRWTVPVACGWALPAVWGLGFLPFWVAGFQLADPKMPNLTITTRLRAGRRFANLH